MPAPISGFGIRQMYLFIVTNDGRPLCIGLVALDTLQSAAFHRREAD